MFRSIKSPRKMRLNSQTQGPNVRLAPQLVTLIGVSMAGVSLIALSATAGTTGQQTGQAMGQQTIQLTESSMQGSMKPRDTESPTSLDKEFEQTEANALHLDDAQIESIQVSGEQPALKGLGDKALVDPPKDPLPEEIDVMTPKSKKSRAAFKQDTNVQPAQHADIQQTSVDRAPSSDGEAVNQMQVESRRVGPTVTTVTKGPRAEYILLRGEARQAARKYAQEKQEYAQKMRDIRTREKQARQNKVTVATASATKPNSATAANKRSAAKQNRAVTSKTSAGKIKSSSADSSRKIAGRPATSSSRSKGKTFPEASRAPASSRPQSSMLSKRSRVALSDK